MCDATNKYYIPFATSFRMYILLVHKLFWGNVRLNMGILSLVLFLHFTQFEFYLGVNNLYLN